MTCHMLYPMGNRETRPGNDICREWWVHEGRSRGVIGEVIFSVEREGGQTASMLICNCSPFNSCLASHAGSQGCLGEWPSFRPPLVFRTPLKGKLEPSRTRRLQSHCGGRASMHSCIAGTGQKCGGASENHPGAPTSRLAKYCWNGSEKWIRDESCIAFMRSPAGCFCTCSFSP